MDGLLPHIFKDASGITSAANVPLLPRASPSPLLQNATATELIITELATTFMPQCHTDPWHFKTGPADNVGFSNGPANVEMLYQSNIFGFQIGLETLPLP